MKVVILTLLLLFCCFGCTPPTAPAATTTPASTPKSTPDASPSVSAQVPVGDTTQTSVDWAGTYKGVTPCADCEGIDVELVLNDNGTFQRTMTYLGKDGNPVVTEGSFTWKEDGATVEMPIDEETAQYWVSEGYVVQLDLEGNKITGDMADKYVLNKV